jgi:hypothetical protein
MRPEATSAERRVDRGLEPSLRLTVQGLRLLVLYCARLTLDLDLSGALGLSLVSKAYCYAPTQTRALDLNGALALALVSKAYCHAPTDAATST